MASSSFVKIALPVGCGVILAVAAMFAACTGCVAVAGHRIQSAGKEKAAALALVKVDQFEPEVKGNFITFRGRVVNNGAKPVSYVKVRVKLLDAGGKVLDTDWTFAVAGGAALQPGEAKTFSFMLPYSDRVSRYEYGVLTD